tara:strand:- start:6278 stop:6631 length:354 start_codon:yes stop_codon:yes gene_type:complete
MTVMMSDSLVGKIDPRCLSGDATDASTLFIGQIFIDNRAFSFEINEFARAEKKVKISFNSTTELVKLLVRGNLKGSLYVKHGDLNLLSFEKINLENTGVKVNLSSYDHNVELTICLD